jgi:hypothetical protein
MSLIPVVQLPSFGFQASGTFHISINTTENGTVSLFLATAEELRAKLYGGVHFVSSCSEWAPHISLLNWTFRENRTSFHWSGTIKSQDVYWPHVVDCRDNSQNRSIFIVQVTFLNRDFMIDYRDELRSTMDVVLSAVYIALTFLWVGNSCLHHKFMIGLHAMCTLSSAAKAVSLAFSARDWENDKVGYIPSTTYAVVRTSFALLNRALLMTLPVLAIGGWCVFREPSESRLVIPVLASTFISVVGFQVAGAFENMKHAVSALVMIVCGSLWYVRNAISAAITLARLVRVAGNDLLDKVSLVSVYGQALAVIIVFTLGSYLTGWAFEFWPVVSTATIEFGILLSTGVLMWCFVIKNQHAGQGPDDEINVVTLEDPEAWQLAVLNLDDPK